MLKMFGKYSDEEDEKVPPFSYLHDSKYLSTLRAKYELDKVAGEGSQLSRILNLLAWLHKNTTHNGQISKPLEINSISLLGFSYGKGKEFGINCRMLATVLAEVYLALSCKSRIVSLHSITPFDGDNHVVTIVWLDEAKKWIFVDPSFNAYFSDEDGNLLSPWELRSCFAEEKPVKCNDEAIYGDNPEKAHENLFRYMSKNLFYMYSPQINGFGSEEMKDQRWIFLSPIGYDIALREEENIEWKKRILIQTDMWNEGMQEFYRKYRSRLDEGRNIYASSQVSFVVPPDECRSYKKG
jgi:hypothetical protein